MKTYEIDHPHNEASALLGIQNAELRRVRGWDVGFWIVSDEREAPKALAALGRTAGGEWEVVPVKTSPGIRWTTKRCEDCETLSRAGSHVYIFGSQFGTKSGPLEPKRHFMARFNEALLEVTKKNIRADLDLVRRPFAIHRLVNDALREARVALLPLGTKLHRDFVASTRKKGRSEKKGWAPRLRGDDVPVNIEGSTFVDGGRLLLGLRYPVTEEGHPIVVEVEGIDRLFERRAGPPAVISVRILSNVGTKECPAGIRELDSREGAIHAITGDLDDDLLEDSPASKHAESEHWTFQYDFSEERLQRVEAALVRRFGRRARVEGIALDAGTAWYVEDDEHIRIAHAKL
jgi:hypothetical protein